MVATVVTYFHPARSFGSMLEALVWALTAVAYVRESKRQYKYFTNQLTYTGSRSVF
jgi:hypothetical protein